VPEPGKLGADDTKLIAEIEAGFETVGELLQAVKLRAALSEAMRLAREVNGYLERAPWFGVIKDDREAAAKTVYTALRAIDSLKILLSPWLPFSSEALHRTMGYQTSLFGEQRIETYQEEERAHEALVYDGATATGSWKPSELKPGQALQQPKPLFKKLDEEIVEQERGRLGKPVEW
jgi:methionyl-tRNA synthetase